MKTIVLQPAEFLAKWPLSKMEALNENILLLPEHVLYRAAMWPLLGEFFIIATYRRRLVAALSAKESARHGRRLLYVHQFASLKKGFGRKLLEEVEKDYDFIYLQSYSGFDQEKLDSYYESIGMTKVIDGCATFFYKNMSLTDEELSDVLEDYRRKSFVP